MRQKKTIALLIGFLMFGTISHATDFPLSKLNLGNSQTEQESIAPTRAGNLPLQDEHGTTVQHREPLWKRMKTRPQRKKFLPQQSLFVLIFIGHHISRKMFSRH